MSEANHPAFDKDEQAILSSLVPEADPVKEGSDALPGNASETPVISAAPAATPVEAPAATPAAPAQAEPAAATPETPEAPAAPQGDPRAALRASRRAEKRLRDELDQVRQENEALRQGKGPVDTSITDTELAELEADFPLQAKIVRRQRELEAQLVQTRPVQQAEFEAPHYDPTTQELIDGVPDLVAWQYDPAAQDKFQRAIAYDNALAVDPDWRDRSLTERFEEATRRTKAALSPSLPTPPAAPAAPRTDPAAVIAAAPVQGPKGISDFRGGAPGNAPTVNYQGMSDEQIMASLPVT